MQGALRTGVSLFLLSGACVFSGAQAQTPASKTTPATTTTSATSTASSSASCLDSLFPKRFSSSAFKSLSAMMVLPVVAVDEDVENGCS